MEHFCTLCDERYLPRFLALYESLIEVMEDQFCIYLLCMSDICFKEVKQMKLEKIKLVALEEIEDEDVLRAKGNRTQEEYCWTCTPIIIDYILKKYEIERCTYLDADLFFFESPMTLLSESKDSAAMIIEHRYTKELMHLEKTQGKYNVQFMPFRNNESGRKVLAWWKERCIEWCYREYEDGKMGDQLYLNSWPEQFPEVYVLKNLGGGVAPWNAENYTVFLKEGKIYIKEKATDTETHLVFFHFHSMKWYDKDVVKLAHSEYQIPGTVVAHIYKSYIRAMEKIILKYKLEEKIKKWDALVHFISDDIDHLKTEHHYYNKEIFMNAKSKDRDILC